MQRSAVSIRRSAFSDLVEEELQMNALLAFTVDLSRQWGTNQALPSLSANDKLLNTAAS
jgi:hypothetical protein